jgi:hypothetical protein
VEQTSKKKQFQIQKKKTFQQKVKEKQNQYSISKIIIKTWNDHVK